MRFKYWVPISFVLLVVSFWNRNNLSEDMQIIPELEQEPLQSKVEEADFSLNVNGVDYQIQPLYDYEIYGLVVSYNHHDGNYGLHKLWNDHLNVADFCVIWRENAFDAELEKLDFWNGQFTCNVKTTDQQAWASFKMNQLSNNHLLTADETIRDRLEDIRVGDQIRIKGWLSSYKNSEGGSRGTSITRDDAGNGACETIFVHAVDILDRYNSGWRKLMYFSLFMFMFSLYVFFKTPPRLRS